MSATLTKDWVEWLLRVSPDTQVELTNDQATAIRDLALSALDRLDPTALKQAREALEICEHDRELLLGDGFTGDHVSVRVQAALASLSTATEGNGWRPIESAPKGETLLVTDGKRVWADFKGAEHGWIFRHGDDAPTHWRPLPAPPEAA